MKEFKDELKNLKNILNKIKELELSREQEFKKAKTETKRVLNMLDDEITNILEKLDIDLTTLELTCRFCEKPHDFEKERELRLSTKEKINELEKIKEKVENNEDELLDHLSGDEDKVFKLLTDLEYEKKNIA